MSGEIIRGPWPEERIPSRTETTTPDPLPSFPCTVRPRTIDPGGDREQGLTPSVPEGASRGHLMEQYETAMGGDNISKQIADEAGGGPIQAPTTGPGGGTDLVGRGLLTIGAALLVGLGRTLFGGAGAWGAVFLVLVAWGWIAEVRDRRRRRS